MRLFTQAPGGRPMTTTPTWRLRMLGSFQLERDGEVVARFTRHKPDLLLAVIALGGHQ